MEFKFDKTSCKPSKQKDIAELSYKDVVISSSELFNKDPLKQANNIVSKFNKNVIKGQNTFEPSLFVGNWVNPNQFILCATNQIPEIQLYNGSQKLRRALYLDPTINTEMIAIREQSQLFFGSYGSYVLNVPVNKYAKAWSGTEPLIFSSGPHVIHDPNFKFNVETGLIDQVEPYIQHGSIHMVRVPAGSIAKI